MFGFVAWTLDVLPYCFVDNVIVFFCFFCVLVFPFGICFCGIVFLLLSWKIGVVFLSGYFFHVGRCRVGHISTQSPFRGWCVVLVLGVEYGYYFFLKFALHFLNAFVVEFCHGIFGLDFLLAIGLCRMAIWRVSLFFCFVIILIIFCPLVL